MIEFDPSKTIYKRSAVEGLPQYQRDENFVPTKVAGLVDRFKETKICNLLFDALNKGLINQEDDVTPETFDKLQSDENTPQNIIRQINFLRRTYNQT